MSSVFGGTEARRIPGASQFPWREIGQLFGGLLAALLVAGLAVNQPFGDRSDPMTETAPRLSIGPAIQQPATQSFDSAQDLRSVQQAPVVVAPVVKEWPKVHVEWTQIGVARNGDEVIALQIPWDSLIRWENLECGPVEALNLPPKAGIDGGFLTERGTVTLIAWGETSPWVHTYWQGEISCNASKGPSS